VWLPGCQPRPARVSLGVAMTSNTHAAAILAAREINASGGIGGARLDLVGLDWPALQSPFDPAATLDVAHQFAAEGTLLAVVGHSDSATTLAAAAVYNRLHVPQIVTIATNPAITGIGEWTYRLCLSDAAQGPALAEYAVHEWKKRRIAIFYVDDAYGRGLAQRFEERARALGAVIVGSVMHRNHIQPDDEETIRLAIARLKRESPPDLIALFQRVAAAQWTLQAIRESGLTVDTIGGDNLAQNILATADPTLTDRLVVSQFLDLASGGARAASFARNYRASTGEDPDYSQAFAYDAVYLFRDAVREGGYTRAGVKAFLDRLIQERRPVHGAGGTFTFNADHDAQRRLYIADVRGSRFHVIKSLPVP
jgi:branched-chain amino acid transport system substrate-binding protein